MTIILAETDGSTVLFGADSAWSHEDEIYTLDMPKIFARGTYLFGVCGTYRLAQLLRFRVELPEPPQTADLEPFLVQELVPAIRRAVVEDGQDGGATGVLDAKTGLLLGCQGQLWTINSRWVAVREALFAAIGSGRLRAYGALNALHAAGVEPAARRLARPRRHRRLYLERPSAMAVSEERSVSDSASYLGSGRAAGS